MNHQFIDSKTNKIHMSSQAGWARQILGQNPSLIIEPNNQAIRAQPVIRERNEGQARTFIQKPQWTPQIN